MFINLKNILMIIEVYDKEASYFGNRAACYLALSEFLELLN